jgi:hypothetical protein
VLKNAFGKSVGWYNVRLVEGRSGVLGINSRPLCLGNTIYLKSSYSDYLASGNQSAALALLVHESTHVWQYQNAGVRYVAEALFAQAFVSNEYSWKKEVDDRKRVHWLEFNREAQASFVEDLYLSKTGAYAALTTETRRVVQEEASQRLTAIA